MRIIGEGLRMTGTVGRQGGQIEATGVKQPLPLEMMAALSPGSPSVRGRIRQAEFSVPAQRLTETNSEGSRRR